MCPRVLMGQDGTSPAICSPPKPPLANGPDRSSPFQTPTPQLGDAQWAQSGSNQPNPGATYGPPKPPLANGLDQSLPSQTPTPQLGDAQWAQSGSNQPDPSAIYGPPLLPPTEVLHPALLPGLTPSPMPPRTTHSSNPSPLISSSHQLHRWGLFPPQHGICLGRREDPEPFSGDTEGPPPPRLPRETHHQHTMTPSKKKKRKGMMRSPIKKGGPLRQAGKGRERPANPKKQRGWWW
ncbi:hypothetical protein V8E53_015059 [Lactarius tabidus]